MKKLVNIKNKSLFINSNKIGYLFFASTLILPTIISCSRNNNVNTDLKSATMEWVDNGVMITILGNNLKDKKASDFIVKKVDEEEQIDGWIEGSSSSTSIQLILSDASYLTEGDYQISLTSSPDKKITSYLSSKPSKPPVNLPNFTSAHTNWSGDTIYVTLGGNYLDVSIDDLIFYSVYNINQMITGWKKQSSTNNQIIVYRENSQDIKNSRVWVQSKYYAGTTQGRIWFPT